MHLCRETKAQRSALRVFAILLLVSCAFLSPFAQAEIGTYSLQEAVTSALEKNPAIQKSQSRIEQTKAKFKQSYSALLPSLSGTSSFSYRKDSLNTAAPLFGGEPYNTYALGLQAQQPLYQGGALLSSITAAREETELAQIDEKIERRDLSFRVLQAFYTVLMDRMKLESLERIQKVAEQLLTTAEAHRRIGKGQLLDVLQVKTQIALLKPQIDQARNQIEISAMELATLIGATQADSISITGTLDPLPWEQTRELTPSGVSSAPEIERLDHLKKQVTAQNEVSLAKHWPDLKAVGTWGRNAFVKSDLFDEDATGWTLGVQATIPIFSGLSSVYERRAQGAALQQLENDQATTHLNLNLERLRTEKELQRSLKQIESSREALTLADESMKEAQKDYLRSLINYQTLLSSQQSKLQAELALNQAKYETLLNLARYTIAWGHDLQTLIQRLGAAQS